jgi:hypothetical protein
VATGLVEQEWLGRTMAVGETVIVKVARPTVRCVMTQEQAELGTAPEILRRLAADNAASLGTYAEGAASGHGADRRRAVLRLMRGDVLGGEQAEHESLR